MSKGHAIKTNQKIIPQKDKKPEPPEYNTHHRKPSSIGGDGNPQNLARVPYDKHVAWHVIFGNMTAQQIIEEINTHWLDPKYKLSLHKVLRK